MLTALLSFTDWRPRRLRCDTTKPLCCHETALDQPSVLQNLPESCLVHILKHVPQLHRLQCCALVSSSWRAAAAAATTSINCNVSHIQHAQQLMCWASTWAQQTTSVQVQVAAGYHSDLLVLPAPHVVLPGLRQLCISGLGVSPTSCSGKLGWLQATPALTQLRLVSCTVLPSLKSLTALTQLTDLQLLQLDVHRLLTTASLHSDSALPSSMWARLTRLTLLDMSAQAFVTDAVLQELSCLTSLQELRLRAARLRTPALACLLPLQQLSSLQLSDARAVHFSCSSTPVFSQLPRLQHLSLRQWQSLDPRLLTSMRSLSHLELDANRRPSTAAEAVALLAALSQLTALTALKLTAMLWYAGPDADAAQAVAAACGGITASSRLRVVALQQCTLPMVAWQYVFPAHRQMQVLQELTLTHTSPNMDTASVQGLAQCCPALKRLVLTSVLQPGVRLVPLLQMTGLTALELGRVPAAEAKAVAAHATGLQECIYYAAADAAAATLQ